MMDSKKDESKSRRKWSVFLMILGTVLVVICPWLFTEFSLIPLRANGDIGGVIGGVTSPIVGLLGAVLVYFALKEQINANNLISDQFEEQKRIIVQQNFENTFFNMLNIHHEIVNNIKFNSNDLLLNIDITKGRADKKSQKEIKTFNEAYQYDPDTPEQHDGRQFFQYSANLLMEKIEVMDNCLRFNKSYNWEEYTNRKDGLSFKSYYYPIYSEFHIKLDTYLGHYFRNLYRIIKMVDEQPFYQDTSEKEFEKKYFYTSIVRSQLSDYEIIWLFFNGLYDYGNEKFKPLMEKYTLLKILIDPDSDEITKFKFLYKETAFVK